MEKVGVFAFGRTGSQRCPNKMLRPFGETTLTDIILRKLAQIPAYTFFAGLEPEFEAKCDDAGVRFVQRDERSATIDEPIREILSFLEEVPCEHLLIVNGCLPFLRVETINRFLEDCQQGGHEPAFGVVRRTNHFLTLDRQALNFDISSPTINTKTVKPVLEFAHALYFFSRDYFLTEGRYWDWQTVRLVEMAGGLELLDIDTEEDFALAESLWRGDPLALS